MIRFSAIAGALFCATPASADEHRCDIRDIYEAATEAASLHTGTPETAIFTDFDDAEISQTGDACIFFIKFKMETTNLQGSVYEQEFNYLGGRTVNSATGELDPLRLRRQD